MVSNDSCYRLKVDATHRPLAGYHRLPMAERTEGKLGPIHHFLHCFKLFKNFQHANGSSR